MGLTINGFPWAVQTFTGVLHLGKIFFAFLTLHVAGFVIAIVFCNITALVTSYKAFLSSKLSTIAIAWPLLGTSCRQLVSIVHIFRIDKRWPKDYFKCQFWCDAKSCGYLVSSAFDCPTDASFDSKCWFANCFYAHFGCLLARHGVSNTFFRTRFVPILVSTIAVTVVNISSLVEIVVITL